MLQSLVKLFLENLWLVPLIDQHQPLRNKDLLAVDRGTTILLQRFQMLPEQHRCVQRSPVAAPCRHYLHSGPLEGGPMSYRLEMFSQKQTCHEIGVEKMVGRVLFSHGIQESKLIDELVLCMGRILQGMKQNELQPPISASVLFESFW